MVVKVVGSGERLLEDEEAILGGSCWDRCIYMLAERLPNRQLGYVSLWPYHKEFCTSTIALF